jgi:hypothetical protein
MGSLLSLEKRRWLGGRCPRAEGSGGSVENSCSAGFWLHVRLLFRNGGVPEELASALRADERWASSRFRRREPVDNDVFHPVAVVT